MQVTLYNFNNLAIDFSSNYFVNLEFSFKDNIYKFKVTKNNNDELLLYCKDHFVISDLKPNVFYKGKDFYIAFVVEDFITKGFIDDKDLDETTIFNKYKLGVFYD